MSAKSEELPSVEALQRLLIRLQAPHTGIEVRDRFHRWDHVTRCFTGRGLIAWLQANTGYQSRGDALRVASHLLGLNLITPVSSYATALAQSAYPLDLAPSPPTNRQRFLAEEERKVETPSQFGGGGGGGPGSGTNGFDFHDDETLYHFVSETEMEESLAYADNLVREYLLFNGMTSTLNAMEKERRGDNRAVSFRARKIVTQLLGFAQSFDFRAMLELWNFLERHFFVKIDPSFLPTIQKLFTSLQRFYLINAINSGAPEKAREFLEVNIGNFRGRPEWERWFMLPFLEKPQTDPSFEMYFAKDWSDAFSLSLGNFLNTLFTHLPLPKMLNFTIERKMRQAMELELSQLRVQCKERQTLIGTLQRQIQDLQSSPSSRTSVSSIPSLLPLVTPASTNASGFASVDLSKPSHHHHQSQSHQSQQKLQSHQSQQQLQQHPPLSETWKMDADKPVTPNSPGIARDISPMTARQVMDRLSEQPLPSVSVEAHPMLTVQSMTMAGDTAGLSNVMISSNPSISSSSSSFPSSSSSSSSSNSQSYSQPSSPVTEMEHIECIVPYSTFVEHKSPVRRCKFSRSGHLIATGSSDGTVRIWPTPKPSLTSSPQRSAEGHSDATHSTIFCFAEVLSIEWDTASRLLLAGTADGLIKLWNVKTNQSVAELSDKSQRLCPRIVDLAYSPNQGQFLSSAQSGSAFKRQSLLCSWDVRQLQVDRKYPLPADIGVSSVRYSANGQLVFAGCSDGRILVFDAKSPSPILGWSAHKSRIAGITLSANGRELLSAGADGLVQQWDVSNVSECVRTSFYPWALPHPNVQSVDISMNASQDHFAIPSKDNSFSLSSIAAIRSAATTPTSRRSFVSHSKSVLCLDFHPTEPIIVTGSEDRTVHLHHV